MAKQGRKPKEGHRVKTTLVIPDQLHHRLKLAALEDRTDVSAILVKLAEQFLEKRGKSR
jgi:hypothetical protein